jgi:hypothetical protein
MFEEKLMRRISESKRQSNKAKLTKKYKMKSSTIRTIPLARITESRKAEMSWKYIDGPQKNVYTTFRRHFLSLSCY